MAPTTSPREVLTRRAFRLAAFTVAYNLLEALASLWASLLAGSPALLGFGLDSIVESLSGGVMLWRFGARRTKAEEEALEQRAVTLVGWTFVLLGAYTAFEASRKLWAAEHPEASPLGLAVAALSLVIMPSLWWAKVRTARALGSRSLEADSKETLACSFLSAALLLGLGLNALWGLWWADPAAALAVAGWLLWEGVKTLREKALCGCAALPESESSKDGGGCCGRGECVESPPRP